MTLALGKDWHAYFDRALGYNGTLYPMEQYMNPWGKVQVSVKCNLRKIVKCRTPQTSELSLQEQEACAKEGQTRRRRRSHEGLLFRMLNKGNAQVQIEVECPSTKCEVSKEVTPISILH